MPDSSLDAAIPSTPRAARNLTGAAWMIASGLGFTIYLVMAKQVSSEVHPMVLAFFRSFFGLVFVSPALMRRGIGLLKTSKFTILLTRSLFGGLGFALSLLAVSDFFTLPLSQFNALSFSRPLFITLMVAVFLGEAVGPHRLGAVAVGFLGVLIMAVPGVVLFWLPQTAGPPLDIGSVLALASALFFAAGITLVKFLSATHSPIQLVVWANLLSSVIFLPGLIFYWSPPSPMAWAMIITMSLTGLAAQYCYITAMSMGDASFLSPMDYLRLPMAALADYVLFQLLPGRYVWIGAAIIVAATLYITLRETRLKTRG